MKHLKAFTEAILDLPLRIVYMFRYWEYVDWRIQTAFYIIAILLMVGVLAVVGTSR
jgi:hypothetical protein